MFFAFAQNYTQFGRRSGTSRSSEDGGDTYIRNYRTARNCEYTNNSIRRGSDAPWTKSTRGWRGIEQVSLIIVTYARVRINAFLYFFESCLCDVITGKGEGKGRKWVTFCEGWITSRERRREIFSRDDWCVRNLLRKKQKITRLHLASNYSCVSSIYSSIVLRPQTDGFIVVKLLASYSLRSVSPLDRAIPETIRPRRCGESSVAGCVWILGHPPLRITDAEEKKK